MGSWKTLVGIGARTTHSSMSCLSTFCSPFRALMPCHRIPMSEKKIGKDRLPLFCVIWLYNSQAIWDEWYYICILVETLDLPTVLESPPSLSLLSILPPPFTFFDVERLLFPFGFYPDVFFGRLLSPSKTFDIGSILIGFYSSRVVFQALQSALPRLVNCFLTCRPTELLAFATVNPGWSLSNYPRAKQREWGGKNVWSCFPATASQPAACVVVVVVVVYYSPTTMGFYQFPWIEFTWIVFEIGPVNWLGPSASICIINIFFVCLFVVSFFLSLCLCVYVFVRILRSTPRDI
jgi:hypothetical protein